MVDKILVGAFKPPDYYRAPFMSWPGMDDRWRTAPVIRTDNITKFMMDVDTRETWPNSVFPNLAPPFPAFWMETKLSVIADFHKFDLNEHPIRAAAYITAEQSTDPTAQYKWVYCIRLFLEWADRSLYGPMVFGDPHIEANGTWPDSTDAGKVNILFEEGREPLPALQEELFGFCGTTIRLFLWAISFMNCRNVSRTVIEPIAGLSRKWKRRHGVPLVKAYTLDIDPMREVLRKEGNSTTTGMRQALHICRAHFKTFTPEKPLLGKHIGTYWWPSQVRGRAAEGVIVKDYNVKAPPHE